MPGPLRSAWDFANKPLLPQGAVQPAQDALQARQGDSVPWAQAKGFGSGALEGLRDLTSPLNLAGIATLPFGGGAAAGAARGAAEAGPALRGLGAVGEGLGAAARGGALPAGAGAVMERMGAQAAPTFNRLRGAGAFAGDRTVGAIKPLMRGGEGLAEFAPATEAGEAVANAARPAAQAGGAGGDIMERILKGGGVEPGRISAGGKYALPGR
jgi:hypothetical protein